jgi:AraC-like DNA-binding protein
LFVRIVAIVVLTDQLFVSATRPSRPENATEAQTSRITFNYQTRGLLSAMVRGPDQIRGSVGSISSRGAAASFGGIAQAVYMSPYHFTKLFKESTGQSPHQYVVEARVRKAKELLTTGKFTISEVAHHVGFADQSHLTRHFKRVFGLPPKRLLNRRRP